MAAPVPAAAAAAAVAQAIPMVSMLERLGFTNAVAQFLNIDEEIDSLACLRELVPYDLGTYHLYSNSFWIFECGLLY